MSRSHGAGTPPQVPDELPELERDERVVNGVRLHTVAAGDPEDDPVLALHGFPECWWAWSRQLGPLVDAGFRVIVPDLRGYNRSEKPPGVDAYRIGELVRDVRGLIESTGRESAHVVAHDWGGLIAWELAAREPDVVDRLVVMNAPHPRRYEAELGSLEQLRRSWYVGLFQLPALPEALFRAGRFRAFREMLREDPVDPDAFSPADLQRYVSAWSRPGALTAGINYYRALGRGTARGLLREGLGLGPRDPERSLVAGRIDHETMVLWGVEDRALSVRLTEGLEAYVPNLRLVRLETASHWVQFDDTQRVNELLCDFLLEY